MRKLILFLLFPLILNAQDWFSTNHWKVSSGVLQPVKSSWTLSIPAVTLTAGITSDISYDAAATIFYFRTSLTATSGTHNNLRARVQSTAVGASTSDIRGVYGQAITNAGLYGGTGTGLFANFIAKNTSTTVTGRGLFAEAETEATPTALTNLYGAYIRTKVDILPATDYYTLMLDHEMRSTGHDLDAFIGMKGTGVWVGDEATYGIDMNGITSLATADIRLHNGETIDNTTDGSVITSIGGNARFTVSAGWIGSSGLANGGIVYQTATATVPNLAPRQNDPNTGTGRARDDQLSLIAGGVEVQRLTEGDGEVSTILSGTVVETVSDATSAGDATLTKSGENFDVTCSQGDAVLVYGGTTAGDYGTYIIATVTSATVLTLDRALAGSDADVDFDVVADGVIIENSTTTGVATLRVPEFTQYISITPGAATLGPNAPSGVTLGTFRTLQFDNDNEEIFIEFEVPDDWTGTSDMELKIYIFPEASDQVQVGEIIEFDATYRSVAEGEAYDNGTAVEINPTYTQAVSEAADKILIELEATIDYDNGNQPLTKGDLVGFGIDRDIASTDTYTGDVHVAKVEITYKAYTFMLHH